MEGSSYFIHYILSPNLLFQWNLSGLIIMTCACFVAVKLPSTLAVYPLDGKRRGRDISSSRNPTATLTGVRYRQGPDGQRDGSTQFYGRRNSYVEIPNTGRLDARYSITVLIWVYHEGRSGIILNYNPNRRGFQLRMISPQVLQVVIVRRTRRRTITVRMRGRFIKYKAWNYVGVTYDERSQIVTVWVNSKAVVTRRIGRIQLDTRKAIRLGGRRGSREYFQGRLFCLQLYSVALSRKQIDEAKKKCFLKGKKCNVLYFMGLRYLMPPFCGLLDYNETSLFTIKQYGLLILLQSSCEKQSVVTFCITLFTLNILNAYIVLST